MVRIAHHDAAQNIAVTCQILGCTMHDEVRAQFQGTDHQRRGEGIVDNQRRATLPCDLRDPIQLPHPQQRIGNRFNHNAARLVLRNCGFYRLQVADVDETHLHASGLRTLISRLTVAP